MKTPGSATVVLPTLPLAEAVADEWETQDEKIDSARMPLTTLSHAALDLVGNHRGQVMDRVLGFGRSDLLCYRADAPRQLALRQAKAWDPLLSWVAKTHGVRLQSGAGVSFIEQPVDAALALEKLVASQNDFQLAGLDRAAGLTGSVVLGLALLDGCLTAPEAFAAAQVDEEFQAETWGWDAQADLRRTKLLAELCAVDRFLKLASMPQA
jgi:chaperone required for assembly of F1-ATPase